MDWFLLTIILSCMVSVLSLSLRAITKETNPFLFLAIVTLISSFTLLAYCLFNHISLQISQKAFVLAVLAGLSVTGLDLSLIFMFRKGATVAISMQIYRVFSIIISAIIGFLIFQEQLNITKILGILLACFAVYLLNSKPKGEQI